MCADIRLAVDRQGQHVVRDLQRGRPRELDSVQRTRFLGDDALRRDQRPRNVDGRADPLLRCGISQCGFVDADRLLHDRAQQRGGHDLGDEPERNRRQVGRLNGNGDHGSRRRPCRHDSPHHQLRADAWIARWQQRLVQEQRRARVDRDGSRVAGIARQDRVPRPEHHDRSGCNDLLVLGHEQRWFSGAGQRHDKA